MRPRESRGFFATTLLWTGGLVGLILAYRVLSGPLYESAWDPWRVAHHMVATAGLLLPFAVFAGGVAVERTAALRTLLVQAVLVGAASYGVTAYAAPLVDYRARATSSREVAGDSLPGPEIPSRLLELRRAVQEHPPERYGHRVGDPSAIPPNWWTHQLHWPWVLACFSLVSALLGLVSGRLTRPLRPPARANARWLVGLSSGVLFFLLLTMGSDWIRSDPSRSAILGTWGPLLGPLGELLLLAFWVRKRGRRVLRGETGAGG